MKPLKLLALLLALIMTLSVFSGCGAKEPASGEIISHDEAEDEKSHETEPPVAEEDSPEEEPAAEEKTVSLGRLEGGFYTNTYAGFGCELDENWTFYTAEELQELPENLRETTSDTALGEMLDSYPQITDMAADNANDLTTMNVLYTKIPLQERLLYLTQTEKEILEITLNQQDMLAEAYASAGIELTGMEIVPVTFLGEDHYALKSTAITQGVDYYILQVMDYTLGAYGVTLTVGSYVEDRTQDLLDLFFAVD